MRNLRELFNNRKAQLVYCDSSSEIVSVVRKGATFWVKGRDIQLLPEGAICSHESDGSLGIAGWFQISGWTGREFQ